MKKFFFLIFICLFSTIFYLHRSIDQFEQKVTNIENDEMPLDTDIKDVSINKVDQISENEKPVWKRKDFKEKAQDLQDVFDLREKQKQKEIAKKAKNIIKINLLTFINNDQINKCKKTVAFRELSFVVLESLERSGILAQDIIQGNQEIPDFHEILKENNFTKKYMITLCSHEFNGAKKENILRTIASTEVTSDDPTSTLDDGPENIENDSDREEDTVNYPLDDELN